MSQENVEKSRRKTDALLNKLREVETPETGYNSLILEILLEIQSCTEKLKADLGEITKIVHENQQEFYRAFLKDEEGYPDIDGHRRAHRLSKQEAERMDDYKTDITKKIVVSSVTFIAGILAVALFEYAKSRLK